MCVLKTSILPATPPPAMFRGRADLLLVGVGLLLMMMTACGADAPTEPAAAVDVAAGDSASVWDGATSDDDAGDADPADSAATALDGGVARDQDTEASTPEDSGEAASSDVAEPDTAASDVAASDVAAPDTTESDVVEPDVSLADVSLADTLSAADAVALDVPPAAKDAGGKADILLKKDASVQLADVVWSKDTGTTKPDASASDAGAADAGATTLPGPLFPYLKPDPSQLNAWKSKPPACIAGDPLARYFRYRARMRGPGDGSTGGFVAVGKGPGRSLLAGNRDPSTACKNDWWVNDAKCAYADGNAKGRLVFGDTTIWHGWYLTYLASEYAAFTKLGVDTAETASDLYHALVAFNRLDAVAETHFGKPGKVDGFFVRGDVPSSLVKTKAGGWRFPHTDPLNGTTGKGGYGCIQGGPNCDGVSVAGGYFESQDQAVGLALGLAMVWRFVPKGTKVQGMDLHHEARAALHRIVLFLRNHKWKVKAPDGTVPPAQWGGSAVPFSSELAKAANRVCGSDFGVKDYGDFISKTQGATIFAGLGASWAVQTDVNRAMAMEIAAVTGTWAQDTFEKRSASWGSPYYGALYALLRDKGDVADQSIHWQLQAHLDLAPCNGPCNLVTGCKPGPRWRGENIFKSPEARGGYRHVPRGEYTGVDYLILHNLWVLLRDGKTRLALPKQLPPAKVCAQLPTLSAAINGGLTAGTIDLKHSCQAAQLGKRYCGRPLAAWLEDAVTGKAAVFLGKARLTCAKSGSCTLSKHAGKGTSGTDLFVGGPAGDTFSASGGNDCLVGGGGDDVLSGGQGRDELWGQGGNDKLYGESSGVVLTGDGDLLLGGPGNDVLKGGPGRDDLYGHDGDDSLDAGPGDDFLYGGLGNDTMLCGAGMDLAMGEQGNDSIKGEAGIDTLYGGPGRDKIDGGSGDDAVVGGEGDDFLHGGTGDDTIWGEGGDDHLCGGNGKDNLNGGWSKLDGCRAKGTLDFSADKEEGCGFKLSSSQCKASAFAAW